MAPRKVTTLPNIVGGRIAPVTKPKGEQQPSPSTTIDYSQELKNAGLLLSFPTTTTTTTVPTKGGVGITTPKTGTPPIATQPKKPLSQSLNESIEYEKSKLYGLYNADGSPKYSDAEIEAAALGTAPKSKGFWGGVGRLALKGLDYTVLKPLQGIDVGRRVVLSGVKELGDEFVGKGGSWTDFYNQAKDTNLTSKELFGIDTGNKFFDGVLGFGIDVLADPTTYLTLGTGTAAKVALQQTTKTIGKELTEQIVKDAAQQLVARGTKEAVQEVTEAAAKRVAVELGEKATAKEIRLASRAIAVEAAQLAKAEGVQNADDILRASISRYSAVAPRKTMGNKAKASVADSVRQLRDEAIITARDAAGTAQGRAAQNFVDVVTDDVIGNIATRGYAAFTDDVAKALGVQGGARFGAFGAKASIPGSQAVTGAIGKGVAGTRLGLAERLPAISDLITGKGSLAGIGQAARWEARTGLSQGKLVGKEAVEAVKLLAQDKRLLGLTKAATKPVQIAVSKLLTDEKYKPYFDTVVDLVNNPEVLAGDAVNAAKLLDRPVTDAELEFAQKINQIGNEFADQIDSLRITTSAPRGGRIVDVAPRPATWFPETLTNRASSFLGRGSDTAKKALTALGLDTPPLPTQNVANSLREGAEWFGHVLKQEDIDKGIVHLNKLANEPINGAEAFKGQFFDQNVGSALKKYADKYAKDYAFLRFIDDASEKAVSPEFITGAQAESTGIAGTYALRKELAANLPTWTIDDLAMASNKLASTFDKVATSSLTSAQREAVQDAVTEVNAVISKLREAAKSNDDMVKAWADLGTDLADNYAVLFARSPKDALSYIENIDPRSLKSMVNMMEDAYVALGRQVAPDAYVRAELAKIYQNVRKIKDPKVAGRTAAFLKDYNNFFKTWVTSTPGFHVRNAISNTFQMLAAGGNLQYLGEGLQIQGKWRDYLKKTADEVAKTGDFFFDSPEQLVQDFVQTLPKNRQVAATEALLGVGGTGASDLEEVFGGIVGGRVGALGKEVTGTGAGAQVSEALGAVPRLSRGLGERIETSHRFMLTYDGIRQGLDPQEAVDRTAKFLIDYNDLSTVDQVARQIIPFWMFMSRNLPVQIQNMFANPRLYQQYNSLRREFEDKDGNSLLMPDYLTQAGATILGTVPGLGAVFAKPDLGFPGTGTPIPGQEAITSLSLDPLIASLRPELKTTLEQLRSKESFGEKKIEGLGERAQSAAGNLAPPLSVIGRYLNPALAGEFDNPVSQALGLKRPGETPAELQKLTALASLFGLPVGVVTPQVENARRFEILDLLEKLRGQ
jgi:hypothetical protein